MSFVVRFLGFEGLWLLIRVGEVLEGGEMVEVVVDQSQTITQRMGTSVWVQVPELESSSFYELRVSYPGTVSV